MDHVIPKDFLLVTLRSWSNRKQIKIEIKNKNIKETPIYYRSRIVRFKSSLVNVLGLYKISSDKVRRNQSTKLYKEGHRFVTSVKTKNPFFISCVEGFNKSFNSYLSTIVKLLIFFDKTGSLRVKLRMFLSRYISIVSERTTIQY